MLLNLNEIQQRLESKFTPLEPLLSGFRLVESNTSEAQLADCERTLGVPLPIELRRLVLRFNFGRFTLGPITFCNSGDYVESLCKSNLPTKGRFPWWEPGHERGEHLLVACSDGFAILLNTESGEVFAFRHGARSRDQKFLVAKDFELFLRGVGTVFFKRNDAVDRFKLAEDVASAVGGVNGMEFWLELAK